MKELFLLGFLNIFRNKRRTFLTSFVIGIGLFCLIVQNGFLIGMMKNILSTASDTFLGDAEVHGKNFLNSLDVSDVIKNKKEVEEILNSSSDVKSFSKRVIALGMISSPKNGVSAQVYGIDLDREKKITKIGKAIKGNLEALDEKSILVGKELLNLLEAKENDHVIVTFADSQDGSLVQERFKIVKTFSFNDPSFDKSLAFINIKKLQKLLLLGENIHEIAISMKKDKNILNYSLPKSLIEKIKNTDNEILSIENLIPSLKAMIDFSHYGTMIVMIIVFFLVIFIIMNTLFMSLFERLKEFGVLKAIGTTPIEIFFLIIIEAGSLALFSVIFGTFFGTGMNYILSKTGINYLGMDISGVRIADPIYPIFHIYHITLYPMIIFIFILLVAIYPAVYAARIKPVFALKKDS